MTTATEARFGRPRVWYPSVGSTMDIAAALAARGAPHGTLVETDHQTAGRGRHGRRWEAPPESALLSSWIMRPPAGRDVGVLSPLVALALMRALHTFDSAMAVGFKWPNDVWLGNRKLAGILLSARHTGGEQIVIAGIGVNVVRPPDTLEGSAWLRDVLPEVTPERMRGVLATELDEMWAHYEVEDHLAEADRSALETAMVWRNETVTVQEHTREVRGRIAGLAPDGSLLLQPEAGGAPVVLRVGEVGRGPRIAAGSGPEGAVYFPEQDAG